MMHQKIIFGLIFLSSLSVAGDFSFKGFHKAQNLPLTRYQIDSTLKQQLVQGSRTNSLKSDLLRSAIGTTVGGIVGAGVGGILAISFGGDYDTRSFPDNSFYLSSYVGAGVLAALSSAAVLHFSKNRDISYWRLASYSLLPPLILVMPLSVHASVQERDELVKAAWVATLASIGISTVWNVFVYRIYPPRSHKPMSIHFAKPYIGHIGNRANSDFQLDFGMRIIEVHF